MGFQSSYSIPEFIDPHSTPKSECLEREGDCSGEILKKKT
ncbi:hypothetical protein T05_9955 [Trichinella murrelli]|uniref:Uncharacterized protein n=1 Tax=Trichinella murrelli TaxID=144512 RepID=A0A0V0SWX1_9BILA|nr:hypothetical protein T05_9955 [Trichinella murrelli]